MVKKVYWHTTFGQIEIKEKIFLKGKITIRPFCSQAGVKVRAYSMPLQRRMTDFGADVSFQRACEKLQEHYGITVPGSADRRVTEKYAQRIRELQPLQTEIAEW